MYQLGYVRRSNKQMLEFVEVTSELPITIKLHQGSVLCHIYLILWWMSLLEIYKQLPYTMFLHDISNWIWGYESMFNAKLEQLSKILEWHGFRVSRSNTAYMEYNFSSRRHGKTLVLFYLMNMRYLWMVILNILVLLFRKNWRNR